MGFDNTRGSTKYFNIVRRLTFPSLKRVLLGLLIAPPVGCGLSFYLASRTLGGALEGVLFGFAVLTVPSIMSELIVSLFILEGDSLFYPRRCLALSLALDAFWILFLLVGGLSAPVITQFPQTFFFLGFLSVFSLRFIVIFALSGYGVYRKTLAAVIQPLQCLLAPMILFHFEPVRTGVVFGTALVLAPLLTLPLLRHIEKKGMTALGVSPLDFFRAFLSNMLDRKNGPIEEYLEAMSVTQRLTSNVIAFRRKTDASLKASLVVANFHPGPFLNVGSSVLPHLIKKSVENEKGGIVMVPHGVSGHELNIVSQRENQRFVSHLFGQFNTDDASDLSTKMARASIGKASATCQCFGDAALVTLTLSPLDMEDIPTEVSTSILDTSWNSNPVVIVDSHNSITDLRVMTNEETGNLVDSGRKAIETAEQSSKASFKIGVSHDSLDVFSPEDGIGPSGLAILLVQVSEQTVAYVTIDGNNMKSGLRERMLSLLRREGVVDGEIMTTDSHMVSGLVPARLGYYPVGEGLDESLLMKRFESAVEAAKQNLEDAKAEWNSGTIMMKTLGRRAFERITQEVHDSSRFVAGWMSIIILLPVVVGLIILR
ncbi:MAG: DUF2070 family protein [archaeon]